MKMNKQHAVLLVHGIFDSSSVLKPLRDALESQGFRTLAPDLLPCDGSTPIATLAEKLDDFIQTHLGNSEPFSIVAFSMGGLISRYYLQCLNGVNRAKTLITLGTPHNGSALAFFRIGDGFKDLRQGSEFLRALKQTEDVLRPIHPLSIYTPFDLMIVPYTSSIWRIAKNVSIAVPIHCSLLSSPRVHQVIFTHLAAPQSEPQSLNSPSLHFSSQV
ncbi:MAG: esterase/lipase family protein [Chlorobiales bacterium]